MGRTKLEINWEVVQRKMEAGLSAEEIYENMCCKDTFYDRFKEHFGENFSDYSAKLRRVGPGNIKFTQYMKALSGNVPMLQLLGREMCGQGKDEVKYSPYEDSIALRHENMMLRAEIEDIKLKINGNQPKAE